MKYPRRNIRRMLCLTCLTLTSALWLNTAVAETIYKTVDAQGNVTFSNTPPPAGVEAQQIEIQPDGPTPAQQQQSEQEEQNLENEANEMESSDTATEPPQEVEPVQPTTEYQQDSGGSSGDEEPVVVDDGYVGDRTRGEVVRDRVEDRRDLTPVPAGVPQPAARVR